MTMTDNEYITLTEAAKVLGVSRSLLPYLIKERESRHAGSGRKLGSFG